MRDNFATKLKMFVIEKGYTCEQMAKSIGFSRATWNARNRDASFYTLKELKRISKLMNSNITICPNGNVFTDYEV